MSHRSLSRLLAVPLVLALAAPAARADRPRQRQGRRRRRQAGRRCRRDHRVHGRRQPQARHQERQARRVRAARPAVGRLPRHRHRRQARLRLRRRARPRRQHLRSHDHGCRPCRPAPTRRWRRSRSPSTRAWPPAGPTTTTPPSPSSRRRSPLQPTCHECYYNIGYAYLQKKDEKQAEENWKKALEQKPDHAETLNALATLYNNQKRFDEAAAVSAKVAGVGAGRQRRRHLQPGHHPVERRQDRRGEGEVRRGGQGRPDPRRRPLPARHGAAQRGQDARGGGRASRNT